MTMTPPSNINQRNIQAKGGAPRWRGPAMGILALVVIGYVGTRFFRHGDAAPAPQTPPDVTVASPMARSITEWDDYVGRFVASQSVDVRPRVSGQIVERHFNDGDMVKKDQVLFTIDQRPFLAAKAEAQANEASAQSALALARAEWGRANGLTGDDAVSASEIDALRARQQAAQAALDAARAKLHERELDVEWSEVRAPISGRVSDRRVDTGNLVVGGAGTSATLLTTINALDPIYFTFDASEALFLKARRAKDAGESGTKVQVRLQDETDYRWTGNLEFTDNALDPRSGTIRGRATFNNATGFLTPGMFGNMRLMVGENSKALLLPDAAIQADQARKIVLVVDPEGLVSTKPVILGAVVDGLRVIRSGLTTKDRVVIQGMQGAMPGQKVTVHDGHFAPDPTAAKARGQIPVPAQATLSP